MSGWISSGRELVLVECYVSGPGEDTVHATADRIAGACNALTSSGTTVDYLGALFVAADEAAFHLFAAGDVDAVVEASRQAGLRVERVVQAVSVGGEVQGAIGHPSRQLCP